MSDRICPSCRATVPAKQRFCGACGTDTARDAASRVAETATSFPEHTPDPVGARSTAEFGVDSGVCGRWERWS